MNAGMKELTEPQENEKQGNWKPNQIATKMAAQILDEWNAIGERKGWLCLGMDSQSPKRNAEFKGTKNVVEFYLNSFYLFSIIFGFLFFH